MSKSNNQKAAPNNKKPHTTSSASVSASSGKYALLGQQLKALRGERSGNSVAKQAGISSFYLHALEHGKGVPSEAVRSKLSEVLGDAVKQIEWPRAYDPASYNHRQPTLVKLGSAGQLLKELRLAQPNRPTQAQVASRLGVTEQVYSRIERGYTNRPPQDLLLQLAQLFNSPTLPDWFN